MPEKLKQILTDERYFTVLLVILVGVASFLLGRESVIPGSRTTTNAPALTLLSEVPALPVEANVVDIETGESPSVNSAPKTGEFVASKSGTRYHALDCPGAKTIKEENKIFFATALEAESAGYTRAANCPGE